MAASSELSSRDLLSSTSSTAKAAAAQLSRRRSSRELGSEYRQVNRPEQQTSLSEASLDGDGRHQDDVREADSRHLLRGVGEGIDLNKREEVTFAPEGWVERNVQGRSLTVGGSAHLSSNEKSTDSHDHQQSRRTFFSLQVEQLGGKGPNADRDSELKETIRKMSRREAGVADEEKRPRFSDLLFTPRLTLFDRHNSERSSFRGIYTLFWLATFFLAVKIGARNWHRYGSVLGGNEIFTLILQRDLLVLGLTDGVLCAATTFCLLLQRLILSGYLSWGHQGWIIQNVSFRLTLLKQTSLLFVMVW